MTVSIATWLIHQSADVRLELDNLLSYGPDPAFIQLLAGSLPQIPRAGLVDLYYDIWYCVPSRPALLFALGQIHDPEKLSAFLSLAERVLADEPACDAFAEQIHDDTEPHELIAWLTRRAAR